MKWEASPQRRRQSVATPATRRRERRGGHTSDISRTGGVPQGSFNTAWRHWHWSPRILLTQPYSRNIQIEEY